MLEHRQVIAEIVLCWDHAARFKGGHVVRRDLVLEDGHIVADRRLRSEPIAGALQPGTAVGEVLEAAMVDMLREADELKRERDETLRQCEGASARALVGLAASLDRVVQERDAAGNVATRTLTGDVTLSFTGVPAGVAVTLTLLIVQDGTGYHAITWPASVVWPNGIPPILPTASGADAMVVLVTVNGGSTWRGALVGAEFA